MQRQEALRRVLFLKTLPDEVIADIAAAGTERTLQRGELLLAVNTPSLGLIVVLKGTVKVYKTDSRGRELTFGLEGPGASVAELPLFDGGNYPASAEAAEDGTTVLVVGRERFQQLRALHPQIGEQALRALAIRMRRLVLMVETQALHTVRARLASYLLRTADGRTVFPLEETNEAIGSQIGTVRDVVSRTLGSLKEAGAITLQGRVVTIRDFNNLRLIGEVED